VAGQMGCDSESVLDPEAAAGSEKVAREDGAKNVTVPPHESGSEGARVLSALFM